MWPKPRAESSRRRARARAAGLVVALVLGLAACASHPYVHWRHAPPLADPARVEHRLILIGDAGDPDPDGEPVLDLLEQRVRRAPERTTVVFLGDNVYETGMPEPTPLEGTVIEEVLDQLLLALYESRRDAERRVKAQVKAVRVPGARAIFIPGNHDWDQFGVGGFKRVLAQQEYIAQLQAADAVADIRMLPHGGCPGPTVVDVGAHARLVILDTQWWLDAGLGGKPTPEFNPTGCPYVTESDVLAALEAEIVAARAAGREAIVVGHHPIASRGPHGGYIEPVVHLFPLTMIKAYVPRVVAWFPLPGLGTLAGVLRSRLSPSAQDFSGPVNRHLRESLVGAMAAADARGAPTLLYAAGHDHSLQLFRSAAGPQWSLVSGLGSSGKASGVGRERTTVFADADPSRAGFMEVDFLTDGTARLAVIETARGQPDGVEAYATSLTAGE